MDSREPRKFEAGTLWRWLLAVYWVAMLIGTHTPPRFKAVHEELGDKVMHFAAFAGLAWLVAMAWQTSTGISTADICDGSGSPSCYMRCSTK